MTAPGDRAAAGAPLLVLRSIPRRERRWRALDAVLFNVAATNVLPLLALAALLASVSQFAVGLAFALVVAALLCAGEGVVYAFLASSMPRDGGDYYFQSRLLSPATGVVFAATSALFGGALWTAVAGWMLGTMALGPFLWALGMATGLHGLSAAAAAVRSPFGIAALTLATVLWSVALNLAGMRTYAAVQRWLSAVVVVSLGLSLGLVLTSGSSVLVAFPGTFTGAVSAPSSGSAAAVVSLLPLALVLLVRNGRAAYVSGEIRGAVDLRRQLLVVLVALGVATALSIGLLAAFGSHLAVERHLAVRAAAGTPLPHFFLVHPSSAGGPWPTRAAACLLPVAIGVWLLVWTPGLTLAASRVIVAMAADTLLPRRLRELQRRSTLAPTPAILVVVVLCLACAVVSYLTGAVDVVAAAVGLDVVSAAVTCAGGALFPFLRREVYRESRAAPYELLGVPSITIAGALFVTFVGVAAILLAVEPPFGLVMLRSAFALAAALTAVSAALVLVRRLLPRPRAGAEVELLYEPAPRTAGPPSATP